jgi:hypothetical protein
VVVSDGTDPPAQMVREVPKLKAGVRFGFTVTLKLTGTAQTPAFGVNIYVPDALLLIVAGLHVPLIPLVEVPGNAGTPVPAQMVSVEPKLNVGVMFGVTVTVKFAEVAHCPGSGVNV